MPKHFERDLETLKSRILSTVASVDEANPHMFEEIQGFIKRNPGIVAAAIHTFSASRHLKRIADLGTHNAEIVVFMVNGHFIRHQHG